jgi:hypothetical protein
MVSYLELKYQGMHEMYRGTAAQAISDLIDDLYVHLSTCTDPGERIGLLCAINSGYQHIDRIMPEWADADELRGRAARNDLGCFQL